MSDGYGTDLVAWTETQMPALRDRSASWRCRLAMLDRVAAAEICRLKSTGLNFDAALSALLASAEGARAMAEYELLSDALVPGCATATHDHAMAN